MNLDSPQRIHIAPQGYEEQRIYKPAIENRADKVVLLVTEGDEQSNKCQKNVEEELRDASIEVEKKNCDIFDQDESIQTISELIYSYSDDDVKVNISTGSKITAISGMLACMLTGATPYYVKAEDYGDEPVSKGVEDVISLPAYPIDPPQKSFVKVLSFLKEREDSDEKVKISDLNNFVQEEELDPVEGIERKDDRNIYDIVNRDIIDPLVEKEYIRKQPYAGSKYLTLTPKGKRTLDFSRHLID
ncbi:HFX_2341 family transcriptional regulator domain-containing protein [Natronorubrum thiooxidans]|uniref:CRISPR locus-related DNA-binding protein n=1 Tax=Natronorubrum thiooxidans TaxID=308853 RepID=A0A1N7H4F1_9EURY|nr:DUF6293 family protein [Natronorubrum thiooxidans]SIS19714.1 CRISPR locus-related DNA-binding protein [Natronorubrum thiooxidans]